MRLRIIPLLIFIVLSASPAAEKASHTVTSETLPLTLEYKGTLVPVNERPLQVKFRHWADAKITAIADHGSTVKKGETLLALDVSKLEAEILKVQAKLNKVGLEASKVEQSLAHLEKSMPLKLEASLLKLNAAKEDLAFFQKALEPLQRKKSKKSLTDMEKALKYTEAEYDQLKKMYSEDQVTEETEEIILERQKDRLRHRKFAVEEVKIRSKQELTYLIPRELQKLKTISAAAELEYAKLKVDLPAERELHTVELESLSISKKSLSDVLTKLKADKKEMTILSPVDGVVYYGTFSESGWNTKISPGLKPGKSLMNNTLWGTLITDPSVEFNVIVKGEDVSLLSPGTMARGIVESVPGVAFETKLVKVSQVPVSAGEYLATFSVSIPEGVRLLPGQKIQVTMTAKVLENAHIVPGKFIHRDKADHLQPYVWLKSDKGVEKRRVVTGISTAKGTQITQGLETGNIIFKTTPNEEATP